MIIPLNIESIPDDEQYRIYKFLKNKFDIPESDKVGSIDLQDLYVRGDIEKRTLNQLKLLRINTVQDLANCQRSMFYRKRGIGAKSLSDIESILHRYGLEFAKE